MGYLLLVLALARVQAGPHFTKTLGTALGVARNPPPPLLPLYPTTINTAALSCLYILAHSSFRNHMDLHSSYS
jgi:hypothetical protein